MSDPTIGDLQRVLSLFDQNVPVSLSYVTPSGQRRTARVKGIKLRAYDESGRAVADIRFEPDFWRSRGQ